MKLSLPHRETHPVETCLILSFALLFSFTLLSCGQPQILHKSQWIMGTVVEITWVGIPDNEKTVRQAFDAIKSVDTAMNPDKESELARISAHAGKGFSDISPFTCRVIQEGLRIGRVTGGAFDIAMGPLIRLWGWDTKSPHLPPRKAITKALAKTDPTQVICNPAAHRISLRKPGMSLDLGGIAKGFAVDRAVALLRTNGMKDFIVNAGGDLYAAGHPPKRSWHIGIQDPDAPRALAATLPLSDRAIATSGNYENFFFKDGIRYHHILDPKTGYPARGLKSVSILSDKTMGADALATALFVLGKEGAIRWLTTHPDYQGILIDAANHIYASRSLKGIIHWKQKFENLATFF